MGDRVVGGAYEALITGSGLLTSHNTHCMTYPLVEKSFSHGGISAVQPLGLYYRLGVLVSRGVQ